MEFDWMEFIVHLGCVLLLLGLIIFGIGDYPQPPQPQTISWTESKAICEDEIFGWEKVTGYGDYANYERTDPIHYGYTLNSLNYSIPSCKCYRIDDTIINLKDDSIASISWDKKSGVNINCCKISFKQEMQMREDNKWKCKCGFDYALDVTKLNRMNCRNETYLYTNYTEKICRREEYGIIIWDYKAERCNWGDKWVSVDKTNSTITNSVPLNSTDNKERIITSDTYEKIFVYNLMEETK